MFRLTFLFSLRLWHPVGNVRQLRAYLRSVFDIRFRHSALERSMNIYSFFFFIFYFFVFSSF
nr:MAG TPA: hypothetical protein [Caudoviricetes sp.]